MKDDEDFQAPALTDDFIARFAAVANAGDIPHPMALIEMFKGELAGMPASVAHSAETLIALTALLAMLHDQAIAQNNAQAASLWGRCQFFLDAVITGKSHPIMDSWKARRSGRGAKKRSLLTTEYRRALATFYTSLMATKAEGMTRAVALATVESFSTRYGGQDVSTSKIDEALAALEPKDTRLAETVGERDGVEAVKSFYKVWLQVRGRPISQWL